MRLIAVAVIGRLCFRLARKREVLPGPPSRCTSHKKVGDPMSVRGDERTHRTVVRNGRRGAHSGQWAGNVRFPLWE
jgi:hypothetical protein